MKLCGRVFRNVSVNLANSKLLFRRIIKISQSEFDRKSVRVSKWEWFEEKKRNETHGFMDHLTIASAVSFQKIVVKE